MASKVVNMKAFKAVKEALENGDQLTLDAIGLIFGAPFYQLIVCCLMDAQEAALAISGSIKRLSKADFNSSSEDMRKEFD
jgi:hypothetical protein